MRAHSPIEGVLYDESKLSIKDKYSFFLGGNAPWVILDTGREDGQNLLIIRDSYTDCLAPFLLEQFFPNPFAGSALLQGLCGRIRAGERNRPGSGSLWCQYVQYGHRLCADGLVKGP